MIGSDKEGDDDPIKGLDINVLEEDVRGTRGGLKEGKEPQPPWADSLVRPRIGQTTNGWDATNDIRGLLAVA